MLFRLILFVLNGIFEPGLSLNRVIICECRSMIFAHCNSKSRRIISPILEEDQPNQSFPSDSLLLRLIHIISANPIKRFCVFREGLFNVLIFVLQLIRQWSSDLSLFSNQLPEQGLGNLNHRTDLGWSGIAFLNRYSSIQKTKNSLIVFDIRLPQRIE